ncbi:Zn-dependent protease with chaperone function [Streptomyces sp. Ag109_G2-6]|uniref:M48 family metallopeptidase n=1 Tax=Streptomyces TaxID=1883 RepID=UPI0009A4B5CB|nr:MULTISPECIES: M48 family metallopeptidase [Streptomyces]RPF43777.1 Zn-dependent protease with chaperone function [Streptomyces sp. Ag109_G2-6]
MEHDLAARPAEGQLCPDCGHTLVATDERFPRWCADCDWNVDPAPPDSEPGRLAAVRRRLARRHGEELAAAMTGGGAERPRRDAAALLALGLALLVHGVTLVLAVAGMLLVVLGWATVVQPIAGAVLLVVAFVLRPRRHRIPQDGPVLYRADAPRLFELIDDVAAVTGTTGVHAVVVGGDVNASVTACGWRRRRVLFLGLGLWEVLAPPERVALLGHELGHFAGGDVRHGLLTHQALRSLDLWLDTLAPSRAHTVWDTLFNILAFLPRCAVYGLLVLLDHLTLRAAQRAEYEADLNAALAGSTGGAVALMERLLVAGSVHTLLRRESVAAQMTGGAAGRKAREAAERGLWERVAAHVSSIPAHEYERLLRVSARRGHGVDDTHPPTHLRLQCLARSEPRPARVDFGEERSTAVAAELAPARATVARQVVSTVR